MAQQIGTPNRGRRSLTPPPFLPSSPCQQKPGTASRESPALVRTAPPEQTNVRRRHSVGSRRRNGTFVTLRGVGRSTARRRTFVRTFAAIREKSRSYASGRTAARGSPVRTSSSGTIGLTRERRDSAAKSAGRGSCEVITSRSTSRSTTSQHPSVSKRRAAAAGRRSHWPTNQCPRPHRRRLARSWLLTQQSPLPSPPRHRYQVMMQSQASKWCSIPFNSSRRTV